MLNNITTIKRQGDVQPRKICNDTSLLSPTINYWFLAMIDSLPKTVIYFSKSSDYSYSYTGPASTWPNANHGVVYLSWRKTLGCTSQQRPLCVGPSQGAPWSERCGLPTTTYITEGTGTVQHYSMHTHVNTTGCLGLTHTAASEYRMDTLTDGRFSSLI